MTVRSRRGSSAVSRYIDSTSGLVEAPPAASASGPSGPTGSTGSTGGSRGSSAARTLVPASEEAQPLTPDLLHPVASVSVDRAGLKRALEFAFVAGDAAGAAGAALKKAAVAESTWDPESFAGDLFIDDFIRDTLHFPLDGQPARMDAEHMKRLLCQPPRDASVVAFRHEVLRELSESDELQRGFERIYLRLAEVVRLFDESGSHSRLDLPRWRLDVLRALRTLFEGLDGPFENAHSGIARLHTFGRAIAQSPGYSELCALLDFEGDTARVNLHLQLGVDGRIRKLDVIDAMEKPVEPFYRSPIMRLAFRVMMFLRGYRVGEAELVERWFDHVYAGLIDFLPALLQLRGDLEFYLSAIHFKRQAQERGLQVCLPDIAAGYDGGGDCPPSEVNRQIQGLWNPLLLPMKGSPVPCDIDVDALNRACIITGPNSGGKTRVLQSLGFVQLLGQAGFFVPARDARMRQAPCLFMSLGHDAAADQQEGRLGTELMRIRHLFECALPGSLVILDELCSGTNPSEGEQIFRLVLKLLCELHPEAYITTHFLQFAQELEARAEDMQLCFLQVELDDQSSPTYQFVPGVATTSLATQTAARLGVTRDELLSLIRRNDRRLS